MSQAKIFYLACPYTSPLEDVRRDREEMASMIAAKLMQQGYIIYSPITHGHAIHQHLPPSVGQSHEFWMRQCRAFMEHCSELLVLPLEGWRLSKGVQEEITFFQTRGRPIFFLKPPNPSWGLDRITITDQETYSADLLWLPS